MNASKPTKVSVCIAAWTRFDTPGLTIAPSLAGATMDFGFAGHTVSLRLPKRPNAKSQSDKHSRITSDAWRVHSGRKIPMHFHVRSVDVILPTDKRASISGVALERVDPGNFQSRERKRFDKIAEKAAVVLVQAFDYWTAVLRWKSGIPSIGHFTRAFQRSGWGTYLQDQETEKRFYVPAHVFYAKRERVVSSKVWRDAARAVGAGETVPVWHQHLVEAQQKLAIGDTRGFALDLAIAVETVVRRLVLELIRDNSTRKFKKLLGTVNLSRILADWIDIGFDSKRWRTSNDWRKGVNQIVETRNAIMHRGEAPALSEQDQLYLLDDAKEFIRLGELELHRRRRKQVRHLKL